MASSRTYQYRWELSRGMTAHRGYRSIFLLCCHYECQGRLPKGIKVSHANLGMWAEQREGPPLPQCPDSEGTGKSMTVQSSSHHHMGLSMKLGHQVAV